MYCCLSSGREEKAEREKRRKKRDRHLLNVLAFLFLAFYYSGEMVGGRKLYDCFVPEWHSYLPRSLSGVAFVLRCKGKVKKDLCHFSDRLRGS